MAKDTHYNKHDVLLLEQQIKDLREEAKTKDEFIRITNHELRTPLDIIRGNLDMVLKGEAGEISASTREYLVDALFGADRLTGLVDDMLDIARITTGQMRFELTEINICELLETVEKEFSPIAKEKRLVLYKDCFKDVPLVYSDKSRLFQIFDNLIGNAFKFTPRGGSVTIRVVDDHANVPDTILVSVIDTGSGIKKEDISKLFKQFPDIEKRILPTEKGTGLGLNLVWHVLKALGGEIWAESDGFGKGTTFFFRLPIAGSERGKQLYNYHAVYLKSGSDARKE
ncbi:MAG: histidine kinase [Parcubacteria group bacterium Gr01-1014_48]|nr:MAG: histidine kinase [Parcubacteria group bacterium Greene0416_14]TSC74615.1 MAG: histidine kinase [Parcubacteria group bacterium Gr01-1014_48]TSD01586.1 MAG: histidine kinase [Parcubacteria group bacterium Greene1014_15]TSD08365.1 MAG: histidine kinase [Parcubacteria group bacterium Greene0714_4]